MLSNYENEVLFKVSTIVRIDKQSPEEQFTEVHALFQKGV